MGRAISERRAKLVRLAYGLRQEMPNKSIRVQQEAAFELALSEGYKPEEISARLIGEMVGRGSLSTHSSFIGEKRPEYRAEKIATLGELQETVVTQGRRIRALEIEHRQGVLSAKIDPDAKPDAGQVNSEQIASSLQETLRKIGDEIKKEVVDEFVQVLKDDLQSIKGGLDSMAYFKTLAAEAADRSRQAIERAEHRAQEERDKRKSLDEMNKDLMKQIGDLQSQLKEMKRGQ